MMLKGMAGQYMVMSVVLILVWAEITVVQFYYTYSLRFHYIYSSLYTKCYIIKFLK